MPSAVLRATCRLDEAAEDKLAEVVRRRESYTARSVDRLLKVARTIADLDGRDDVDAEHLDLAASFRDTDPSCGVLPDAA
jgi:magnesium chelatase family protein